MEPINAQAFSYLADVRRTLTLARYYRQIDQTARDLDKIRQHLHANDPTSPMVYDGQYGFVAKCLRISARTMMVQIEKQAGACYMLGFSAVCVAWLSDMPFREWPEYKQLFPDREDVWSNSNS